MELGKKPTRQLEIGDLEIGREFTIAQVLYGATNSYRCLNLRVGDVIKIEKIFEGGISISVNTHIKPSYKNKPVDLDFSEITDITVVDEE